MAQLLAPYNNAMRLGQGFNSYTQQICLDQAVLPDTKAKEREAKKTTQLGKGKIPVTGPSEVISLTQPIHEPVPTAQTTGTSREMPTHEDAELSLTGQVSEHHPQSDPQNVHHDVPQDELQYEPPAELVLSAVATQPVETEVRTLEVHPWVKPQIVTYSSRFVDKLSDVTDAMNISGSLSIKTATIGGKANGSYVDSDKFKSSDINFHLQVRVTNQM